MGCCCLQLTFQACNINEARTLYDQLSPMCPIMVIVNTVSLRGSTRLDSVSCSFPCYTFKSRAWTCCIGKLIANESQLCINYFLFLLQLALTAASPLHRGYVADTDCRWNIISGAVDCRTREERGLEPLKNNKFRIFKSRYDSIDSYLSPQGEK